MSRTRKSIAAVLGSALVVTGIVQALPADATPAPPQGPIAQHQPTGTQRYRHDNRQFVVSFDASLRRASATTRTRKVDAVADAHGASVQAAGTTGSGTTVVRLSRALSAADASAFVKQLKATAGVTSVRQDLRMFPTATPTDPEMSHQQWDLVDARTSIRLPGALDIADGSGVTVGVIDSGITSHPDLAPVSGYDFISDATTAGDGNGRDTDPSDAGDWLEASNPCNSYGEFIPSSWHGSHTTGTIAARTNNGVGIAGIAGGAKVFMARALGHCGGYSSDINDAMRWAGGVHVNGVPDNPHPAQVLNLSLGGDGSCDSDTQGAIDSVVAKGVTVVVAAGNDNKDASAVNPANCRNVVVVASEGPDGNRAYYSNYGSMVDIAAPGGNQQLSEESGVLSTVNSGQRGPASPSYAYMQGTSMAAPHVAGVVALMKSANPTLTPAQVENVLKQTARAFPGSCPEGCGAGLVDATAAVQAAAAMPGGKVAPTPTPSPTATPTPSPTANPTTTPTASPTTPSGSGIANPGFESAGGWQDPQGAVSAVADGAHSGSWVAPAHSGSGRAWLGGWGRPGSQLVSQQVSVPAGATTLGYWVMVHSSEVLNDADTFAVGIDGQQVDALSNSSASTDRWVQRTVDVSGHAGRTVTLSFRATEDYLLPTSFVVDDVTVR